VAQTKPRSPLRLILGRLRRAPQGAPTPEEVRPLVAKVLAAHPKADTAGIVRAYQVAKEVHEGQLRLSGDPFITHPLAVAEILADMGMDPTTIVGALLHDAVEDTDASLDDLRESFGDEVAQLVDGVTKLTGITFQSRD